MSFVRHFPSIFILKIFSLLLIGITSPIFGQGSPRLEKIYDSGKIIVGTRLGSLPFSDVSATGEFYGFN